jgi:hypothetical protein
MIDKCDFFGSEVYKMNVGGRQVVGTSMGAIVSMCVVLVVSLYACKQLPDLLMYNGPIISKSTKLDVY